MMEWTAIRLRRKMMSEWNQPAVSNFSQPLVWCGQDILPVTCEGERVCASRVHQLFLGGARFFPGCLLCGAARPSDHCADMAGEVEVTPTAMCCGRCRRWADSAARFRDALGQTVGVEERERTLLFHLSRPHSFMGSSCTTFNDIFSHRVHEWISQNV